MKNYVSLQSQRDKLLSLIKAIAESDKTVLSLIEEDSHVSERYEKELENIEEGLVECLDHLGYMIGVTIYSDMLEVKEVKL